MKFRKKSIIIDAEPYHEGLEDGIEEINLPTGTQSNEFIKIPYVNTLKGRHYITESDYIVTGVKGERYPIKKDIFEMTYELVESANLSEIGIETNQLINQICDTFHDELKVLANKYGIIYLSIKQINPDCLVRDQ